MTQGLDLKCQTSQTIQAQVRRWGSAESLFYYYYLGKERLTSLTSLT